MLLAGIGLCLCACGQSSGEVVHRWDGRGVYTICETGGHLLIELRKQGQQLQLRTTGAGC